jgi:uncharacterized protein YdeI (BOF family)
LRAQHRLLAIMAMAVVAVVFVTANPALATHTNPRPIPGGLTGPDGQVIHVFAPGPKSLGFQGKDAEPNTITDFRGFSALAYVVGTATDAEGNTYSMFNDMRVFQGSYVGQDGNVYFGTFAFI